MIVKQKEIRSFTSAFTLTNYITRSQIAKFLFLASVLLNVLLIPINAAPALALAEASQPVNVWWPTNGAHLTGTQPFKAMVQGLDPNTYDMYWQVDGGALVPMDNSSTDYPHKEAQVDLSGWTWHGSGPYDVTFVAKQGGTVVAQSDITIYVDNGLPAQGSAPAVQSTPAQTQTAQPQTTTPPSQAAATTLVVQSPTDPSKQASIDVSGWGLSAGSPVDVTLKDSSGNVVLNTQASVDTASSPAAQPQVAAVQNNGQFYVDPNSEAAAQAAVWAQSNPAGAAKMSVLAAEPTAKWFGAWSGDIQSATAQYVNAAASAGKVPVLVAYNIPGRDCGGYSSGGANSSSDYLSWIGGMSRGIGSNAAVVILEPDALPGLDCLSSDDQAAREQMLASAVSILKSNGNTKVYLDAGNATWKSAADMAPRLERAGLSQANGFSLNVSGFETTASSVAYGQQISSLVGGSHFVIDTSRNGNGSNGQWCNPTGRAIGNKPTTQTGNSLVDAFLWIKTPGESDGTCNGGPSAGTWWPDYALSLVP